VGDPQQQQQQQRQQLRPPQRRASTNGCSSRSTSTSSSRQGHLSPSSSSSSSLGHLSRLQAAAAAKHQIGPIRGRPLTSAPAAPHAHQTRRHPLRAPSVLPAPHAPRALAPAPCLQRPAREPRGCHTFTTSPPVPRIKKSLGRRGPIKLSDALDPRAVCCVCLWLALCWRLLEAWTWWPPTPHIPSGCAGMSEVRCTGRPGGTPFPIPHIPPGCTRMSEGRCTGWEPPPLTAALTHTPRAIKRRWLVLHIPTRTQPLPVYQSRCAPKRLPSRCTTRPSQ